MKGKRHWMALWHQRVNELATEMILSNADRKKLIITLVDSEVFNELLLGVCVMVERVAEKGFRVYFQHTSHHYG